MKSVYNEKYLINFIRYGAIIAIISSSFLITQIFINDTKRDLKENLDFFEQNYIEKNKKAVKQFVDNINNLINLEKKFKEDALKEKLKEQVYQAHAIATAIYNREKNSPNYSKEKTIEDIKTSLEQIKLDNKSGYIFMYEMSRKYVMHSQYKNLEGKNFWNYKDIAGTLFLQEINEILRSKNETFYEWYWKKTEENREEDKKIGFFKKFEFYDLFIGTGDYLEEFQIEIKKEILKKLNDFNSKSLSHVFIYDLKGLCLVNPNTELVGVNRSNVQNENGKYIIRDILNFTKDKKEGFIHYKDTITLNRAGGINDKISFVKLYEEWGWVIGSSFYLKEFYAQMKNRKEQLEELTNGAVNKIIVLSFFITSIMVAISYFLSKAVDTVFKSYKIRVKEEMLKKIEKEKLLVQQSKMAIMGEMIANIAHQWKQPLSVISMANSLIKMAQNKDSHLKKEQVKNLINDIENSVIYLNNTIDDFRNFFKPDKEQRSFALNDLLEKTNKLISSQLKDNGIEIIKNIQENVKVFGYENELLQVLINLIKNSKDELCKLGRREKKYLMIDTYNKNEKTVIKIKDNAGGIDPNIIDRIFEPYFTTKNENQGTGIGLYMSKQIIVGMKGKISVSNVEFEYDNEKYKGAEFKIVI